MNIELMNDFTCALCLDDNDQLLYTQCGHRMCKKCKENLFSSSTDKSSIPCPFCREPIKKKDITPKSPEEIDFENEIWLRQNLKIEMNETLEDFESVEAYYDFLELYEDIGIMV